LFKSGKCEPLPTAGINEPGALRERLLALLEDSVSKLMLQMRNADGVLVDGCLKL
jgi:hypothetical protein